MILNMQKGLRGYEENKTGFHYIDLLIGTITFKEKEKDKLKNKEKESEDYHKIS